jgi:hypothetical protein
MTDFRTLHPMPETSSSDTGCHSLTNRCQPNSFRRYWTRLAKRRAALLESNRPRNNQPETHRDDEVRGAAVESSRTVQTKNHYIGLIDFLMP